MTVTDYSHITGEQLMGTLREVVAENPEHVYEPLPVPEGEAPSCAYVHGDTPGCLVGHVLNRLGVPLDVLSTREGNPACDLLRMLQISDERATAALDIAQERQDTGSTWLVALEAAERRYAR